MFTKLIRRISSSFAGGIAWPKNGDDETPKLGTKRRMSEEDDDESSGSLSKRSRAHDPVSGPSANEDGMIVPKADRGSSPPSPLAGNETEEVKQVTKGVKEVELEDKKLQTISEGSSAEDTVFTAGEDTSDSKDITTVIEEAAEEPVSVNPVASDSTTVVLALDEPNVGEAIDSKDDTPVDSISETEKQKVESASETMSSEEVVEEPESNTNLSPEAIEIRDDPTDSRKEAIDLTASPIIPAVSMPLPPSPEGEELLLA